MWYQTWCQSATPHSVKAAVSLQIPYFLKGGGMNKKRKMLSYSPLVGGQNGTPVLGLCHFISEKNVVQAPRVFKVNSYIDLSRLERIGLEFIKKCPKV